MFKLILVSVGTIVSALAVLFLPNWSYAAESCEPTAGRLVSIEGHIEIQRTDNADWIRANLDEVLCQGDTVRAGPHSRGTIALVNEAVVRIDQSTAVRLVDITEEVEKPSFLSLLAGALQSFSRKPREFEVDTPYLNGSIEGTEFVFQVEDGQSLLTVLEGRVLASNDHGRLAVASGESVTAEAGTAPMPRTMVRPRDAVQWALYYPPVLSNVEGEKLPADLHEAIAAADRGDPIAALERLDRVSEADRDARFFVYRATLLLFVGQVNVAQAEIRQALSKDPNAGLAYALRAVISVVHNERKKALADADKAVELSPDSSAAHIARSYAQQGNFEINKARDSLLKAVEVQPQDPLAWARLAELQLMLGFRERAIESAERAISLAPNYARTQITLGFVRLAEFRADEAAAIFEQAVAMNSADPLPRLGLGLAKISGGNLKNGRTELEVAVALDSNNALLRTYLGKAYFEEKKSTLDSEQFDVAKQLDPRDPTAFLYDGIRLQTENRPVDALRDIQKSIEFNDNRAAYRGRLLLDQDRAARGTSLARVYKDLGFTQLGVSTSAQSLLLDPSNASAHRFLSDSYQGVRRHEIARVSELLQAQLLQDINVNPVQPSLSETNLNIVTHGGPATPGFNEFTPLFAQNSAQFNLSGFAGNNDTAGGEAVVSGLFGRSSFSVGAFTYESDGWRDNSQLEQNVFDVYVQTALTPKLNIQAEFLHRESDSGDLAFNFDPDDFLMDKRREGERDSARFGLRYTPTPRSKQTILFSYIYSDLNEKLQQTEQLDASTTFSVDADSNTQGSIAEGQFIYQGDRINVIVGAAHSDPETTIDETVLATDINIGPLFSEDAVINEEVEQTRGYLYTNFHTGTESIDWTIGASYDDFKEQPVEESNFNPKFGVRWQANDKLQLRAAAFQLVKPTLINNRTIEPTQIAGFNQFFDDASGTESTRYGAAFDWRLTKDLSWGGEVTWRDLKEPNILVSEAGELEVIFEEQEEEYHRLYVYWTPMSYLGVKAELIYDRYVSEMGLNTDFGDRPENIETISVPIGLSYFNPSGFFASIVGTYVDQDVKRSETSGFSQGDDNFFAVDAAMGYRFKKRRGIVSLGIKNLFDQEFNFQDDSFREFSEDATTGPYFPELTFMARMTLNF